VVKAASIELVFVPNNKLGLWVAFVIPDFKVMKPKLIKKALNETHVACKNVTEY
jgi:hypothetical protein